MMNNITVTLTPAQVEYIITCVDAVRLKSSARKLGDAIIETLVAASDDGVWAAMREFVTASDENNSQKV